MPDYCSIDKTDHIMTVTLERPDRLIVPGGAVRFEEVARWFDRRTDPGQDREIVVQECRTLHPVA